MSASIWPSRVRTDLQRELGSTGRSVNDLPIGSARRSAHDPVPAELDEKSVAIAGVTRHVDPPPFDLSVIVPTRNEAGNVAEVVRRVDAAAGPLEVELIFIDDSDDDTPAVVRGEAEGSRRPVRLVHRPANERSGGLGGAVVAGFRAARAPWAVVMDGDLQHPPELIPDLLRAGQERHVDLVVASRYLGDGNAEGLANMSRVLVSGSATMAAKVVFPRRLRDVTDPMSGFFAVRLAAIDIGRLRPRGFKILLEVAVRSGALRCAEVPFRFGARHAGESKASTREGLRLVRQMLALQLSLLAAFLAARRTLWRAAAFGAVGLTGVGVNLSALWALADPTMLHLNYLLAAVVATEVSTTWNFAWTEVWVFAGNKPGTRLRRFLKYLLMNNVALLLRLPLLALLVSVLGLGYLLGNALTLLLLFLTRFHVSDRFIYRQGVPTVPATELPAARGVVENVKPAPRVTAHRRKAVVESPRPASQNATGQGRIPAQRRPPVDVVLDATQDPVDPPAPRRGTGYLPHRYDVGGVVTIGSAVKLKELEYFRAPWLGRNLDIEIRVGEVGSGTRRRATVTRSSHPLAIRYEEHLGRLGASFHIAMGQRIEVTVQPLLARSPHVLYTNVLEALLRFVMVDHDKMLLHSACVELGDRGLILSARTDTGKTGTVLRLLREHGARFLSDDMTVLEATGIASCFPKPLTISAHTLRAVDPGDMPPRQWRWLRVQSRLHSKEGRAWGMLLGEHNIPIMSLNSITQIVVPPPKYVVDRLVPSDVIRSVHVRDLFIIERGPGSLTDVDPNSALDELIDNTDDAYGFPPFRYFAPSLVLGGADYDQLRARERQILAAALQGIRIRRMASDNFGWADEIPAVLHDDTCASSVAHVEARSELSAP